MTAYDPKRTFQLEVLLDVPRKQPPELDASAHHLRRGQWGWLHCPLFVTLFQSWSDFLRGRDLENGWRIAFLAMLAIGGTVVFPVGKWAKAAEPSNRSGALADLADTLGTLEEQSYAAWKSRDKTFWTTFLSPQFIGWGRSGRLDKSAAARALSGEGCQIAGYRLTNKQVSRLTPNAAVLTHKTEVDGSCDGKQLAPASYTATVYVQEAGRWQAAFRAQSAIVDPMKATKPATSELWSGGLTRRDVATQTLLGREQAVWSAWKDRDARRIDALLSDPIQFIDIFGNHIGTRAEALKAWSGEGCDVKGFEISGAKATMFTPDVGVLTVRATADAKCFGQDVWPVWGSSVYVKRGKTWLWSFGINVLAGAGSG